MHMPRLYIGTFYVGGVESSFLLDAIVLPTHLSAAMMACYLLYLLLVLQSLHTFGNDMQPASLASVVPTILTCS